MGKNYLAVTVWVHVYIFGEGLTMVTFFSHNYINNFRVMEKFEVKNVLQTVVQVKLIIIINLYTQVHKIIDNLVNKGIFTIATA